MPDRDLVEAYRSAGGKGPLYAEVPMCYAASEDKAREIAHRYHRWSLAGGPVMPELPDPETFDAASGHITPDDVAEEVSLGPAPEPHLKAIREYIDAGYDHLILTQIGPEQDALLRIFRARIAARRWRLRTDFDQLGALPSTSWPGLLHGCCFRELPCPCSPRAPRGRT